MSLRYGVIGTGAIGGYYGGKLAKAGNEVHFLFKSDYEFVKKNGLRIDSIKGDFTLNQINAYYNAEQMPKCDVVLVCLKTTQNIILKNILPPLLHKDTIVILIQNGLGMEADLQNHFPNLSIAGGLAFICSTKIQEGYIKHLDYGRLNIGSYSCKNEDLLKIICENFNDTGVEAKVVDLNTARWMKLVWNIPYNGTTVVLNTTTDKLMADKNTYDLVQTIMLEVIHGANKTGCNIKDSYAEDMLNMTLKMTPYAPSMKVDYDLHRPLEIEYIYSRPISEALKYGYEMPSVSMLEKQLKFIENKMKV